MNPLNPLIGQWDNQEYGKYLPKRCRKVHLHQSSMGIYFSTDDKKSETNGNLSGLPWKKSFFWMSSRHSDDNADMMFIYQTTRSWRIPVTNWNPLFFILVQDSCHHWYQHVSTITTSISTCATGILILLSADHHLDVPDPDQRDPRRQKQWWPLLESVQRWGCYC